jgi:ParB family chromosome partitioning protein
MAKRVRAKTAGYAQPKRVLEIALSQLSVNPKQPRKHFDDHAIDDLARSILEHGLIQPIAVMPKPKSHNEYYIVAGERRFRAFQRLERETIPAIVTTGKPDEIALVETIQRDNLNPLEEAEALRQLQDKYGYTQAELAMMVGKARSTIANLLAVNTLPAKIKKEGLTSSATNRSFLIELAKVKEEQKQLELWELAKTQPVQIRMIRAKNKDKAVKPSQLNNGERFVKWLEALAERDEPITAEAYDNILDIYERFLQALEKTADKIDA